MYIIIDKNTQKSTLTREKTIVSEIIGLHRNTISKKEVLEGSFEHKNYVIFHTSSGILTNKRGNRNSLAKKGGNCASYHR